MKLGSIVLVCSIALVGCGSGGEGDFAKISTPTFLEGEWVEETCYDINDELTEYGQTTFKFMNNQVTIFNRVYATSDCSGAAIEETTFKGDFEIGEDKVLGTGETITQFEITTESVTKVANTESKALELSSGPHCGIDNWEVGVPQSIYDCFIADQKTNILKEIALIENGILYLGYYDERGEDGYSDMVDDEIPYIKQ